MHMVRNTKHKRVPSTEHQGMQQRGQGKTPTEEKRSLTLNKQFKWGTLSFKDSIQIGSEI